MRKTLFIAPVLLGLGLWFIIPQGGIKGRAPALVAPSGGAVSEAKTNQEPPHAAKDAESPKPQPTGQRDPSKIAKFPKMSPRFELYTELSQRSFELIPKTTNFTVWCETKP